MGHRRVTALTKKNLKMFTRQPAVLFLLLLFPLGTLLAAASPSRAFRWAVVGSFTAAQIVWLVWLWRISAPPEWPP